MPFILLNVVYLWVKQKRAAATTPHGEIATTTHQQLFMPAATYSPTPSRVQYHRRWWT